MMGGEMPGKDKERDESVNSKEPKPMQTRDTNTDPSVSYHEKMSEKVSYRQKMSAKHATRKLKAKRKK
jgi:hypothetical protein